MFIDGIPYVKPALANQVSLIPARATIDSEAIDNHYSVETVNPTSNCNIAHGENQHESVLVPQARIVAHLPITVEWSHLSLNRSCQAIDVLVPDWVTITLQDGQPNTEVASKDTRMAAEEYFAGRNGEITVLPRIQFDMSVYDRSLSERAITAKLSRAMESQIVTELISLNAHGACLDLEPFTGWEAANLFRLVNDFKSNLQDVGFRTCIIMNATRRPWLSFDLEKGFDQVILKAFYEPWIGSAPTPLSRNDWLAETVKTAMARVGGERLTVALGNFAASWEDGSPIPKKLSYGEVIANVSRSDAELHFAAEASGSFTKYQSINRRQEKVWMNDAASMFNNLEIMKDGGASSIGVWSLGYEDPGIWPLISAFKSGLPTATQAIETISLNNFVQYVGKGPALRILEKASLGYRQVKTSAQTGLITEQNYGYYPTPYQIERYGAPKANEVVLTFDDGPHPKYTTAVLKVLEELDVPATFFVLGQNVMNYPDLVRRIVDNGHEVGTHSFSHPRMDQISYSRTNFEHDFSHRALSSATGQDTVLYREPFLRSGGPISSDRIWPLEVVQGRGTLIYGMDVVPKDWLGLSSQEISAYVVSQVEDGQGNVILLHDGGENRTPSVEALPSIISELRDRGYIFTTVSETLGINRSELMPEVSGPGLLFDRISFAFASLTITLLQAVFWCLLLIGLFRFTAIFSLALLRRKHTARSLGISPKVSVIIPAFNEEVAIHKCIESVLSSDYQNLEVVVVDDGSRDNTINEALEFKYEARVRYIFQPNQGKWSALNRAISSLNAEVAVCIDADTEVRTDAISKMVEHFADPKVGAVAGKITVGNVSNLLTAMQALEYVTAQNFDRRAYDHINGILVVPGALGAWRVSALKRAGLFCGETLTEDCDLTLSVSRSGYRIVYEEQAIAVTEAPRTVSALLTQRLRWSLGMFQSAWKHKNAVRERRTVGLVSIPDMVVFGYLFPLLAPVADLLILVAAYGYLVGDWTGDVGTNVSLVPPEMIWAYLALPAAEFAIALFAVLTDPVAKKRLILIWPVQRIIYRPLLYVSVFRALVRAASGSLAAWGKSKRYGGKLVAQEYAE
ncbi:glycosyltransferase [Sulfitobacter sp. JB4-11]|uniref:glycosyltransferase n=1 Tax=Sulfitobacter rhodophyticola TaxID=3238304 RepID=UPI003D818784